MTEVRNEAVEALHAALSYYSSIGNFRVGTPAEVIKHLAAKGFTITHKPAMSDTELERRATMLVIGIRTGKYNVSEIVELAKKYRG